MSAVTLPVPRAVAKSDARRAELAASALQTLGELGYARTSLREIAQNSPFSHGVVHYYFDSKVELIIHAVREYKKVCVTRYDDAVIESQSAEELGRRFSERLVETLHDDIAMHRLWYDLRTAAMYEPELRDDVAEIDLTLEAMVWRIVTRFAELAGAKPAFDEPTTYALIDGLFEKAVFAHLAGDPKAGADLQSRVAGLVPALLG
ncbi:TetR/AcrR family transcriptional regulator [Nocardioides jiangxiensis]|uniref:TetR/AcrR family transcriptional regulator n=1 Tax=Nocardioides jiangxiensis TaxID=3064524 RepID=A0ABT9B2G8_9ACTN|nr:TetR/AcrR family transcriptional regulator [Nocardioides sp. WY-20]MDO7868927.1 TetR/AcrR family transcriptional regulator [Nocardioides sp. WY-20]